MTPQDTAALEWRLDVNPILDVLGPFPIHAREQHFLSPAFPLDLKFPIDFNKHWPSSYGNGGQVSWSKSSIDETGRVIISYPDIRWSQLRATEGWAALQHHSILRAKVTVYPPNKDQSSFSPTDLTLSFKLLRGSFFALLPAEIHPSRSTYTPRWYPGDIYAMGELASVVQLPVEPATDSPTSYDLYISGDYEIRLFGDPRVASSEMPALDMNLWVEFTPSSGGIVREHSLDVFCDFVDGFAFGDAVGIGLRSISGWWTVTGVRFARRVDCLTLSIVNGEVSLAPGQARTIPLRIAQEKPFMDIESIEVQLILDSYVGEEKMIPATLQIRHKHLSGHATPIVASYFFASSMPTAFIVKPPLEQTAPMEQPKIPVLLLHGAGVNILTQPFWSDSLPAQKRSWIVIPTGRTSWGFDWHGPSADDVWCTVSALRRIVNSQPRWFGWRVATGDSVLVIGHSNGGQGAWYISSRWPDRVVAAIPAAAYMKAQAYVPLTHSRSAHFIDPDLRAILETAYTPDDNDLFLSNVAHTPILAIHGADDDNVPVWHTREVLSSIRTWNPDADIKYSEDVGRRHWYPHIFKREQVLEFVELHLQHNGQSNSLPPSFTLTVISLFEDTSLFGWKILAMHHVGRLARLRVYFSEGHVAVETSNVRAFIVGQVTEGVGTLRVDAQAIEHHKGGLIERSNDVWKAVDVAPMSRKHVRASSILNTSGPLTIVIPDNASQLYLSVAIRIAHSLQLFYGLDSKLVTESQPDHIGSVGNVIVIGNASSPFLQAALSKVGGAFSITDTEDGPILRFQGKVVPRDDGVMFLHAHPASFSDVMLVLLAEDGHALERVAKLFPMRTGISVPDWLIVRPQADMVGAAGVRSAGIWDDSWGFNEAMSWQD